MHWLRHTLAAAAVMAVSAGAVSAQVRETTPVVSTTDIQRLQDIIYDTSADIARLRNSDSARERFENELDELRDEVVYLKVKQRKQGTLSRAEYTDVRDRLQDLRGRVRSGNPANTGVSGGVDEVERGRRERERGQVGTSGRTTARSRNEVPAGQELDVRLDRELNSKTEKVEDRFTATTLVDVQNDERMLIPAGSVVRGIVTSVDRATRVDRKGRLSVSFDQITIDGRTYPIRATVTEALESEGIRGEAARIGAGAGVGAIIGGILGGMKGAIAGILIGGGGTIAATEGTDVQLEQGTVLRIRLDSPVTVR